MIPALPAAAYLTYSRRLSFFQMLFFTTFLGFGRVEFILCLVGSSRGCVQTLDEAERHNDTLTPSQIEDGALHLPSVMITSAARPVAQFSLRRVHEMQFSFFFFGPLHTREMRPQKLSDGRVAECVPSARRLELRSFESAR